MWAGLLIGRVVFEITFLKFGAGSGDSRIIMLLYALRGFSYPLLAFGFLIRITADTPPGRVGTAAGWLRFAFTSGSTTLGPHFASFTILGVGADEALWWSLDLVIAGKLVALPGIREPTGGHRLVPSGENPLSTLLRSVTIAWNQPKTAAGCVARIISAAPQYGFLVSLPICFTKTVGLDQSQWLRLLSLILLSNIIWNLLFGIIGDKFGSRRTVVYCCGVESAVSTSLLDCTPHLLGPNYPLIALAGIICGASLAGYVPLSALMPSLVPEHKPAAMSMPNQGTGASMRTGLAPVGLFLPLVGVAGAMWIFALFYLPSAPSWRCS